MSYPSLERERVSSELNRVVTRRRFLQFGGAVAAGLVLPGFDLAKTEAAGLFGDLEVSPDWLRVNHPNVQAMTDAKDANGHVIAKFAVVNNTLSGPEASHRNSILYRARVEGATNYPYIPIARLPMQNTGALLQIPGTSILMAAGEGHIRGSDTTVVISPNLGEVWGDNLWHYGLSGGTLDLLPVGVSNGMFVSLGNNGRYEDGPGGFLTYTDISGAQKNSIKALTLENTIRATNLKSAGFPMITGFGQDGHSLTTLSSGFRRLAIGIDVSTIDWSTATAFTNNYLANELGYVHGLTEYTDSLGEQVLVTGLDRRTIYGFKKDSSGKPTAINYSINFGNWFDNQGIPNILKGTGTIYSLWAKPDSAGNVHIWFFGAYTTDDNHAVIGHFIKGTNPGVDKNALFWKDLGPLDVTVLGPLQNRFQFKEVKGQKGFEIITKNAYSTGGFSGIEFYPINNDFSPNPNAELSYPNNGLERSLVLYNFLPVVMRRFFGGW